MDHNRVDIESPSSWNRQPTQNCLYNIDYKQKYDEMLYCTQAKKRKVNNKRNLSRKPRRYRHKLKGKRRPLKTKRKREEGRKNSFV